MKLDLKYERLQGEIYGYPECCIEFYLQHCETPGWYVPFFDKYPTQWKRPRGFIPCEKHMDMIEKGLTTHEQLITNRKFVYPYPIDLGDVAFGKVAPIIYMAA